VVKPRAEESDRTALVVAGAGARGAYEAGVLRTLLPALHADGHPPTMLFGTSAGALNVVGLAAYADLGPAAATVKIAQMWEAVRLRQVSNVLVSGVGDISHFLLQLLGARVRLTSLLDTRRLAATVAPLIDWEKLHENIRTGPIDLVGVATTSAATGGTVVFVEKKPSIPLPPPDLSRNITYVETTLTADHALASAAIPVAFRPVQVSEPPLWKGWYFDGGVRLNAPIKPAVAFGASRIAAVATQPVTYAPIEPTGDGRAPDIQADAAQLLRSVLADRMIEDLRTLSNLNDALDGRPHPVFRPIEFVFAGPPTDGNCDIGDLAERQFETHFAGHRGLRSPDLWLLSRLIGGSHAEHGDLLSFLFFDPAFTVPAADLGARHAQASTDGGVHWQWTL
jgi:NTE family protein